MLPIKHLDFNRALAQELVTHWRCNPLEKDFLKGYRISSNAITWFEYQKEWYFLRYTPEAETSEDRLASELDFLKALRDKGYPAVESVNTLGDQPYSKIETKWGTYYAACFKQLKGSTLSDQEPTLALARLWGESLGQLHALSTQIPSTGVRSYSDLLEWSRQVLKASHLTQAEQQAGLREVDYLLEALSLIPQTAENYGRIHYDFEADNLIYHEATQTLSVLDFDDSHMHFFTQDVERALNSLADEWQEEDSSRATDLKLSLLEGYQSIRPLPEAYNTHHEIFVRYGNLYGYVRILHALSQMPDEVAAQGMAEWLPNLLKRLDYLKQERSRFFVSV